MAQEHEHSDHGGSNLRLEEVQAQLSRIFQRLERSVPLYLFTSDDTTSPFNQAAKEILRTVAKISPKIQLEEYDLDHEKAKRWGVDRSPTILFDPDHYGLRWFGAPLGEEGRMFIEALVMLGNKKSDLSDQSRKILDKIT